MVTAESLTLAVFLLAPGVIAVLIGVTLGVVEREISRDKFYLTAFISSILISVIFIWLIQWVGDYRITDRTAFEAVFFGDNRFNIEAALLLFILSVGLGVCYGILLTYNVSDYFRRKLAYFRSHRRNPWQPWVGGLRNADIVQVELQDGHDVIGRLAEYSRAEKERQLVLHSPRFDFEDNVNREKVIISEDQISLVQVIKSRKREGVGHRLRKLIKSIRSKSND